MSLTHLEENMILFTILFWVVVTMKEVKYLKITTDGTSTSCSGTAPVIQVFVKIPDW